MEVSGQLHAQGKSPRHPLNRRLGGPQSWYGRGIEEKNSNPGLEIPTIHPVAQRYTTELPQLQLCGTVTFILRNLVLLWPYILRNLDSLCFR
jgi:hypothetical protein